MEERRELVEAKSSSMVEPEKEGPEEVEEEEEEYVLLDLGSISHQISIPSNVPYVLSGLDTVNPILTIDNKIKLIGEYKETMGTCLVFTESDGNPEKEAGPSEAKQINPMAQLNKVLKFRLYLESSEDGTDKQGENPS